MAIGPFGWPLSVSALALSVHPSTQDTVVLMDQIPVSSLAPDYHDANTLPSVASSRCFPEWPFSRLHTVSSEPRLPQRTGFGSSTPRSSGTGAALGGSS